MSGTLNIADIATEVYLDDVSAGVRAATGTIAGKTVYFTGMSLILGRDSTKTYKVMLRAKQYHQIYYNYPIQL